MAGWTCRAAAFLLTVAASCASAAAADEASDAAASQASATAQAATSQPATAKTAPAGPWLVNWLDYGGDLAHRPALTGDWGGVRQDLMDHGVKFDLNLTQTLQGNISNGVSKRA